MFILAHPVPLFCKSSIQLGNKCLHRPHNHQNQDDYKISNYLFISPDDEQRKKEQLLMHDPYFNLQSV